MLSILTTSSDILVVTLAGDYPQKSGLVGNREFILWEELFLVEEIVGRMCKIICRNTYNELSVDLALDQSSP